MAQQVIGIGTVANDGTGDPARTAFGKVNTNFTEVYGNLSGVTVVKPSGGSDTAAIQAALDTAGASGIGNTVLLAPGSFNVGPLIMKNNGTNLIGSGRESTQLFFTPTGNATTPGSGTADPGTCIQVCKTAGSAIIYGCSIKNLTIYTSNTANSKVGIRLCETGQFDLDNIHIDNFNGQDTVGVQTMGHESLSVRNLYSRACVPLRISQAITAYGGLKYGGDHFNFNNCYLASNNAPTSLTHACVLIDDGVFLSNFGFDGYQSWVGCKYGLYWVSPSAVPSIQYNIYFHNIRKEQAPTPSTSVMFHIDHTSGTNRLRNVLFQNCINVDYGVGFYLRNIEFATMINCHMTNLYAGYIVDATTILGMDWIGMWCQSTDTVNLASNFGPCNATYYSGFVLPKTASWVNGASPRATGEYGLPTAIGNTGAAPAPNMALGSELTYTQNSNVTWGAPTNAQQKGQPLTLFVTHDGTGGNYTTAWNATYRNAPTIAASAVASSKATFRFVYDGTNWQYIGGSTAFA